MSGFFYAIHYICLDMVEQNDKDKNKLFFQAGIENWKTNRRRFIKTLSIATVISHVAYLESCTNKVAPHLNDHFSSSDTKTLKIVLNILFPDDGNGPSIYDVNAFEHILWVLDDTERDPSQNKYLKDGVVKINNFATETMNHHFLDLTEAEHVQTVDKLSKISWGESWLSMLLTLIFEAVTIDEIYNVNTNQVGWKWLNHEPGHPRPNKDIIYPKLLQKLND